MLYYYEADNGQNLFWSESELTEAEQRSHRVHDVWSIGRLYDRLCVGKKDGYLILPIGGFDRRRPAETFTDPDNPKLKLLRYTDTPAR